MARLHRHPHHRPHQHPHLLRRSRLRLHSHHHPHQHPHLEATCIPGVPGLLISDVCCASSCGTCAGSGCSKRNGGGDFTGQEACCGSGVRSLGRVCSDTVGAPCVVRDDTPSPTPAPMPAPTPAPVTEEDTCIPGVPGLLISDVCCPSSCGSCAGSGCSKRNGGGDFTGQEACCGSGVRSLGRVCSDTVGAPCVVEEEATCIPGVPGLLKSNVCCASSCGSCAGSGCSGRNGGGDFTGQQACCGSGVRSLGRVCSDTVGAPCVVEAD